MKDKAPDHIVKGLSKFFETETGKSWFDMGERMLDNFNKRPVMWLMEDGTYKSNDELLAKEKAEREEVVDG